MWGNSAWGRDGRREGDGADGAAGEGTESTVSVSGASPGPQLRLGQLARDVRRHVHRDELLPAGADAVRARGRRAAHPRPRTAGGLL